MSGSGSHRPEEIPLGGGRWTAGVVRVGDTVRRRAVDFTGRLLTSLHAQGFEGCPRYLGRDDAGRDVLSFLPGEVPPRWRHFDDDQIVAAARLLREMHDASRPLAAETGGGEVICHHDPGPNNAVFRSGIPVAFIDFDFAAPGDPLEDVAYLAWSWCVSTRPDRGPAAAQAAQVRLLSDAYGLTAARRAALPDAITTRILRNEAFWRHVAHHSRPAPADKPEPPSPANHSSPAERTPAVPPEPEDVSLRPAAPDTPAGTTAARPETGMEVERRLVHEATAEAIARANELSDWSRREADFVAANREVFAAALDRTRA